MSWKINKDKCIGCGNCANACPEGIEIINGKAEIKNGNADCMENAVNVCPAGAIINDNNENDGDEEKPDQENINPGADRNFGQGFGRGLGKGLGRGPRDGRGGGFGGGGRRGR